MSPAENTLLRFVNAGLRKPHPVADRAGYEAGGGRTGTYCRAIPRCRAKGSFAAGKTYDVLVNLPTATDPISGTVAYAAKAYGVFDRQSNLFAGNTPDSGMQTFLQVGGANLPTGVQPVVVPDIFTVPNDGSQFQGNVLLNDTAVFSAAVQGTLDATKGT